MPTVLNVHDDARTLLNDTNKDVYIDDILLPFTKKAYQEIQDELSLNGIETMKEVDYTTNLAAGATEVTPPSDFILPIEVWEKPQGAADSEYIEVVEKSWDEGTPQRQVLGYWQFVEDKIRFIGATENKTVKIKYWKFLTALADTTSNILITNAQLYLASRVAAIAAFAVGGNPDRSEVYQADADRRLRILIAKAVKNTQGTPSRRQPFRATK